MAAASVAESGLMNHPAAEIVAIALRKIKKVANSRKFAKLTAECDALLGNIQTIIPPLGSKAEAAAQAAAAAAAVAVPAPAVAAAAAPEAAAAPAAAAADARAAAAGPAANGTDGVATTAAATEGSADVSNGGASVEPLEPSSLGGADATVPPAPLSLQPEVRSSEAGDGIASDPEALAAAVKSHFPAEEVASMPGAAGPATATTTPPPAAPLLLPDLVPRTDTAISDAACGAVVGIMRLAVGTQKPEIIEVALDCLQKLIAFRFMQGSVYAATIGGGGGKDGDGGVRSSESAAGPLDGGPEPLASTPQAQAVELICCCDQIPDEKVELQILKGLLTAATSTSFTIHGQALLLAVRTCYNIYVMSRSEVNQTTAKASLTQMLNVVFHRMEADMILVEVKPIAVTDVLGLPRATPSDATSVTTAVQSFLNNVVMVSSHVSQSADDIRSSVADIFEGRAPTPHFPADDVDDEREHFQLRSMTGSHSNLSNSAHPGQPPSSPSLGGGNLARSAGSSSSLVPASPLAARSSQPATPQHHRGHSHLPASHGTGESAEAGGGNATVTSVKDLLTSTLRRDAFLVFRALCKLSTRTSDAETLADPANIRGKILALELLKILLENSGPTFRHSEKFTNAIRQHLCLSLLKNSASSLPQAAQLSCSIFISLLTKFRQSLKAEVGVFFPMILLKPFEPPAVQAGGNSGSNNSSNSSSSIAYRGVVLRYLREMVQDGQLVVDVFVNYDCDLESSNLFDRLVNGLVKLAQQPVTPPGGGLIVDQGLGQQEQMLRADALQTLAYLVEAMLVWYRRAIGKDAAAAAATAAAALEDGETEEFEGTPKAPRSNALGATTDSATAATAAASAGATAFGPSPGEEGADIVGEGDLGAKRAYKAKFQEGITLFNKKPKKGIELLQKEGMIGPHPEDVATFLAKTEGLNKTLCGDYLGERDDFNLKVMHAYVDAMDYTEMDFDVAIRQFLNGFRLPGEAQKIDRLMEKFAERYVKCNPNSFKSADVAYVLAYSVIMLNTDAHNPQVKVKMSREAFIKNNRGINDGQDIPEDFMSALYARIVSNEIKMKDDVMAVGGAGKGGGGEPKNFVSTLLALMGATNKQVSNEPSEEAIQHTLDYLQQKAKSVTAVTVTEADAVRPMMEVIWAPLLGALSVLFDEYNDPRLLRLCLTGFAAGCCLTAEVHMSSLRDIFINSLCNFTHLHSPATMRYKNALAFKYLLKVAESVGDHLEERWVDVLRCISRWELLQQIASGMPTDAALFSQPPDREPGGIKAAAAAINKGLKKLGMRDENGPGGIGGGSGPYSGGSGSGSVGSYSNERSIDSLAMNEPSIKRVHIGGSSKRGEGEDRGIPQDVINSVDSHEINRLFLESGSLNAEAIVVFVRALASISADELRNAKAPRVFALTKIIEVAHFNMTRIRLVWSRIWAVLSEYFIGVGCHSNLAVAMYAVDALRQLAMKFLERDELANYTFQNDFLRPFVVVMRQSQSVEIRELIIRCLSQMVLARVTNVKSGWKSMFMVFTTAAGDREPTIVRLAFDTIEKIVREHFNHITETETSTFTDCVNCLIAFTNNPHSLDVALNSIAFLRFCAMKLAEGAIGDLDALPEGYNTNPGIHPLRVLAIDGLDRSAIASAPSSTAINPTSLAPLATAAAQLPSTQPGGSTPELARSMKFIDRDEHMYFWFPLLAGLSELTFDPRQEIRHSALEVLFDTLKFHGGTFAQSFWVRIFDSVLLPIFDHVRAEVTDTTTFTSEKRRQQEDAWLYETCTKCLQHLVDLFVEFYDEASTLLSRLLDLLKGFMNRSHQSLAAVGVAAFVRLATRAGTLLGPAGWEQLTQSMVELVEEIAPSAYELVTPQRGSGNRGDDNTNVGGFGGGFSSMGGGFRESAASYSRNSSDAAATYPHGTSHSSQPQDVSGASYSSSSGTTQPPPADANGGSSGGNIQNHTPLVVGSPVRTGLLPNMTLSLKRSGSIRPSSDGMTSPPSAAAAAAAARAFNLREGMGARRLLKFRCQAAVQLLLVQGASEIYSKQHQNMSPAATATLLQALETMHRHAHATDMDIELRKRLAVQQAEDKVPDERQVLDPPLLRLETEAAHACLSVLLHVSTSAHDPAIAVACNATQRMVLLVLSTLSRYTLGVTHELRAEGGARTRDNRSIVVGKTSANYPILMATPAVEYATFAPLVSASLKALAAFDDATFRAHLPDFFPLLTRLIRADYAPPEVHKSLADLFLARVGPLIGAAAPPLPQH